MRKALFVVLTLFAGMLSGLYAQTNKDTLRREREDVLPVVRLSEAESEEDEGQDISGLLSASKDIFVSTAGYTFGPARFKIRGYESEYTKVMFNGIPVNDMETGRVYWSVWGGLNDVVRDKEVEIGIAANPYGTSVLGGYTNIIARASKYRKGTKLVYSHANRSYRNRLMITHSTGVMDNGFAVTLSASRRWANEGYVPGTFYDAYSYFLAVEKMFSDNHSLNLVVFNAPKRAGSAGFSTQEAYDLAGTNYYNPNWGWQNGKKRNARVSNYFQPKILLNDFWRLNSKTEINTGFMYSYAKGGRTKLNWSNRLDPRPDYYKNLPSMKEFYDEDMLKSNPFRWEKTQGQLLWDNFYYVNAFASYYVQENVNGTGETLEGKRAVYMVEEAFNNHQAFSVQSTLNHTFSDNINIQTGVYLSNYTGYHFKEVNDLLGADFWMDYNKFVSAYSPWGDRRNSDNRIPNHAVKEGDIFGYNYNVHLSKQSVFAKADFLYPKTDIRLSADYTHTGMQREGLMQNGLFPDNSLGKSELKHLADYSVIGEADYKITGRHIISANAAYLSRSLNFNKIFMSPRNMNGMFEYPGNEIITSYDISYIIRYPRLKSRITAYRTDFKNTTRQRFMFLDGSTSNFVNFVLNKLDKVHTGVELALEYELIPGLTAYGIYSNNLVVAQNHPQLTIFVPEYGKVTYNGEKVYLKGYHVGRGPEEIASIGFKYWSPSYFFGGMSFNYMNGIYISKAESMLLASTYEGLYTYRYDEGTPYEEDVKEFLKEFLQQEKRDPGYTVNAFVGKSWRINYKYYINVSLNVSNVLDNQNIVTGGFEQSRFSIRDGAIVRGKFDNKYFYLYGRQYFLNVSFRF